MFKNKRGNVNKIVRFPAYVLSRTPLWVLRSSPPFWPYRRRHTQLHCAHNSSSPRTCHRWLASFSFLLMTSCSSNFDSIPTLFKSASGLTPHSVSALPHAVLWLCIFRMQKYNAYFFGKILILGCPEAQKENTSQSFLHFRVYFLSTAPIIQYFLSGGFLSTFNNISKF